MARAFRHLLAVSAVVALVAPLFLLAAPAAAAALDCGAFTGDLYQQVRPSSGADLLTRSSAEAATASEQYGYTEDDGTLAKVATAAGSGLSPVWRLYKSGDFVWAADGADANGFVAKGYAREFVDFYAGTAPDACVSPVEQLVRNGYHRMATASQSVDLLKGGWTVEHAAAFYAVTGAEGSPAPPPGPTDTKFDLAILPDTQNETCATCTRFANRVSWLVDNSSRLDLRYALQVGDLVNWGNVEPAQFVKVSAELRPLELGMHWAGAIGNHDTAAVCAGGSACPGANTSVTVRDTTAYNSYFPVSRFPDIEGAYEPGKVDNAYRSFSAGGVPWLILNLELWPRQGVVSWARSVVATHAGENVIVLTHAYLQADGSIGQTNGGYGATSPQYLYDNLIKAYPNIKFVLSGHVGTSASRTDTGVNGNKIVSILTCYHSPTNPVRLLQIDTAAGTATSTVYAPGTDTNYPSDATSNSGLSFVR
jgi:hypothetical protein